MRQFINRPEDLVTEAIDGMLRTSGGTLARLDGFPNIKVVMRADWTSDRVALISGGGSGHEPAHAGFVGQGMLTAAVCGEVFASPSVEAVLAGLLAVTGPAGALLIVKNYTGDRLNFGLAAERARALGKRVEMVIVDDDIALPDDVQSRGLAGTLFVHKIAGALAESGADLDVVAAAARAATARIASIGMSLDSCTVPGSPKQTRLEAGMAELGLGIHGEPGIETVRFESARNAIALMLGRLTPHFEADERHALLINNLGGCTPLEMAVVAEEVARSDIAERIALVVGPSAMMTSLDMPGISLSVLPLDAESEAALLAEVAPTAWPGTHPLAAPATQALPEGLARATFTASDHAYTRALIERACMAIEASEAELNALDAKIGDGDTGSTLATGVRALRGGLDRLPLADPPALFAAIAGELGQAMGGSSGVLLAILFSAAADAATRGADPVAALIAGQNRVMEVGGAQPGDRTLLDALAPALRTLADGGSLSQAATAARAGADATANMSTARAGRAAYVASAALSGTPDPGAEAVARLFEGVVGDG